MRAVIAFLLRDGRGKVIRTLDPRFPKPVLYQAELYPEFRLDPLPEPLKKGKSGRLTLPGNPLDHAA